MRTSTKAKKTNKKQNLVSTALTLFIEYGIKRVSVEEICRESATSKGTFYKYFANKTELLLEIITTIVRESNDQFKSLLGQGPGFKELVENILIMKQEFLKKYSERFIRDLYEGGIPEVQELLIKMQADAQDNSLKLYETGIADGSINKDISADYFLYLLNQVMVMYTDPGLIKIYPDPILRSKRIFDQLFYGMAGKPKKDI